MAEMPWVLQHDNPFYQHQQPMQKLNPLDSNWSTLLVGGESKFPELDCLTPQEHYADQKAEIEKTYGENSMRKAIEISRLESYILGLRTRLAELAVSRANKECVPIEDQR
jgi:hypothetical protein